MLFFVSYLMAYQRWSSLVGIVLVLLCGWLLSHDRKAIRWSVVARAGLLLVGLALLMLVAPVGQAVVSAVASCVVALYGSAEAGIVFLFGNLADPAGPLGFVFAVRVLPMIIFFGGFMALLYYYGLVQTLVRAINTGMGFLLGFSGPAVACAVANSFLGQTEAPLLIRHYLPHMSRSSLFMVMVSGMATISGVLIAIYGALGIPVQHLLASSIMAIPATILIVVLMEPGEPRSPGVPSGVAEGSGSGANEQNIELSSIGVQRSLLATIAQGALDGMQVALVVGAMLVTFVALIAVVDKLFAEAHFVVQWLVDWSGHEWLVPQLSLAALLGWICYPVSWLLGLRGEEAQLAASFLGIKLVVNEMVAYREVVEAALSPRALMLLTYLLCGFGNISSIGIQLGCLGALAPEKKELLAQLGARAVIGAQLANLLCALLIGLLL